MPNRNYNRGRAKEYRTMKEFRDLGYDIVLRSAGSHSKIDVIAIDTKHREIRLVQCKSGKSKERELEKLLDLSAYSGTYNVRAFAV